MLKFIYTFFTAGSCLSNISNWCLYSAPCQRLKFRLLGLKSKDRFLVSKETVVLRRWGRSRPKFGFIKRVDKG